MARQSPRRKKLPKRPRRNAIQDNLQSLRTLARLTQEDLAQQSGIRATTIRSIEQGTVDNPKIKTVAALAKALGVAVGELIGEVGLVEE